MPLSLQANRRSHPVNRRPGRPWSGRLHFDRKRHREYLHLPFDYPRINQFPEWFTVESGSSYEVQETGKPARVLSGAQLETYELSLQGGEAVRFSVKPL